MGGLNPKFRMMFELESSDKVLIPHNYLIEKDIIKYFLKGNQDAYKELDEYKVSQFKISMKHKNKKLKLVTFCLISLAIATSLLLTGTDSNSSIAFIIVWIISFLVAISAFAWGFWNYRKQFVGTSIEEGPQDEFNFIENRKLVRYFNSQRALSEPIYASSDVELYGYKIKPNLIRSAFSILALIGDTKQRYAIHHPLLFSDGSWWFPPPNDDTPDENNEPLSKISIKKALKSNGIVIKNFADLIILLEKDQQKLFDSVEYQLVHSKENMISETKRLTLQKALDALRHSHEAKRKYVEEGTKLEFEISDIVYEVSASWFNKLIRGTNDDFNKYILWMM